MKFIEKTKSASQTIVEKTKALYSKAAEKLMYFINKDNFTKTKLVLGAILSLVVAVITEYTVMRIYHPQFISKNRIMLLAMIYMFIGIHFVFKLSNMYEYIHKNRYKIACAFLLFVTVFKYSGSSITSFHEFTGLQPNFDDSRYHTLLGKVRTIRTDEWATSTTYLLSQGNSANAFSYFSNVLRGTETEMFTVAKAPVLDILMLGRPFQIGFLLFGNDMGLSFYWYARLVAMMLGSYELCLILTKRNKKVSLCGMIAITFSAAVQWWYCMHVLIYGQIVIVLIDKFMNTEKKRNKYLCALGILIAGLSYVLELYPAWQISFGYLFLAMVIWILIKNIKYGNYKFTKHDIAVIAITILCLVLLLGRWYILSKDTIEATMNTDYPGERVEIGGGALNLYSYFYNIFFAHEDFLNPCEFSSMLSFFPIPMILGLIYVIRNKKDLHFWIPMLVAGGFLTIYSVYGFPKWFAVLTKMSMAPAGRVAIPVGTICIYMLIYLLGNIKKEDKLISKKLTYILSGLAVVYIAYKCRKTINLAFNGEYAYLDKFKLLVSGEIFLGLIFGILNMNNEKIRNYTLYGIIAVALLTGLTVNPVIRTTDIFTTKPVAVKMQEIKMQDPEAIWVVNDGGWYLNDYAVANGIRTLNSTNIYPNMEMYETILGDKAEEKRKIYNRYSHVMFEITDKESDVELIHADNVAIKLNYKDLEKLDIGYILSKIDLNELNFGIEFEEVYDEDGIYIFKVTKGN